MSKRIILCILDGLGINLDPSKHQYNPMRQADIPTLRKIFRRYPTTLLNASGAAVGLQHGQIGNSEVGHLTIGAGRIIEQSLVRIGKLLRGEDEIDGIDRAIDNNCDLHLIGLFSDGGVHSHIDHLYSLIDRILLHDSLKIGTDNSSCRRILIHIIGDGRDVLPKGILHHIQEFIARYNSEICSGKICVASLCGRYYAMDRDRRMDRTIAAVNAIMGDQTEMRGLFGDCYADEIEKNYNAGFYDEFLRPCSFSDFYGTKLGLKPYDIAIFYNFRADRMRQIYHEICRVHSDNLIYTFSAYDSAVPIDRVIFPNQHVCNTLSEILSKNGIGQCKIAETEKYAHVTFFFNGGKEDAFPLEDRILIPSPKVATYDLNPEMSAHEVTNAVLDAMKRQKYGMICVNYANADMVGHTGNMQASIAALEHLDRRLSAIIDFIEADEENITLIMTSDHGNIEYLFDAESGQPHTAHTLNPVPCSIIGKDAWEMSERYQNINWHYGKLCFDSITNDCILTEYSSNKYTNQSTQQEDNVEKDADPYNRYTKCNFECNSDHGLTLIARIILDIFGLQSQK